MLVYLLGVFGVLVGILGVFLCALDVFCSEGIIPKQGEGWFGIPKLYVKFWWPLFLAIKFTFLFLDLAKIQFFLFLKVPMGGSTGLGIIPKKTVFYCFPEVVYLLHFVFRIYIFGIFIAKN